MEITEEMVKAYVAGCEARDAESMDEVDGFAIMRAGLAAAAPLIAAQALHAAAVQLDGYADDDGINWARTFRNGLHEAANYVRWIAEGRPTREPATRPGRRA